MTASQIYRAKTVAVYRESNLDKYGERINIEKEYQDPIFISERWAKNWAPFASAIEALSGIQGVLRAPVIANVLQAVKEMNKAMPNKVLATIHAVQAVLYCEKLYGMDRQKCESIVLNATGVPKEMYEEMIKKVGQTKQGKGQQQQQRGQQQQQTGA
jgi:hypothetical protein